MDTLYAASFTASTTAGTGAIASGVTATMSTTSIENGMARDLTISSNSGASSISVSGPAN
jgi:hypothetical protein